MHLTLEGRGRRKMRLESTLDHFDAIVDRAADAARRNGVALGDATVGNLVAMGITAPRDEPWRRWAGLGEDSGEDLGQGPGNGEQHRPPSVTVGERQ